MKFETEVDNTIMAATVEAGASHMDEAIDDTIAEELAKFDGMDASIAR